jgi:undecaprenyl-diphosphatase
VRRPDLAPVNDRLVGFRDLTVWQTRGGRQLVHLVARLAATLGPHVALLSLLLVSGLLITGLTAASAEIYDEVDDGEGVAGLDRPVLDLVLLTRSPVADRAVTAYTDLGGPVGMPALAVMAVLAMTIAWRQWTPALLVLAASAGSLTMTVVGKAVVGRTRPPLVDAVPPYESSASFPSGHALNAVVIAGIVAYLLIRRQRRAWARTATLSAAGAFAFTMGISRVYLGHHWLTDVLVAWTLGLAWLTVVVVAHRLFLTVTRRSRHNRVAQPT